MQHFGDIFGNHVLLVALSACFLAQGLKFAIGLIREKEVNLQWLFSTGGMPSAHSALVTALATGVGQTKGWGSSEFAIACLFAIIVMYDATGVRQAVGKQAKILNQIIDDMFQEDKEFNEERLKELLGHTPFQVLMGLALGIGTSLVAEWAIGGGM
ncbi:MULTISPECIES: divergent PAP2 family protein [unclassified Spirulina]|uniref:divergent PAP2 family protein n=1 Tax=unclassified Spirulina TaxID=2684457 RepID=UPI00194ED20C|nr:MULTISPECIES: divergent PAP2 family protein [Spirulina]MEA5471912.1 divergent PAP2 family protein [Spirulina sp. 06S082]